MNLIALEEICCCRWFCFLPEQAGMCVCVLAWTGSAGKKNGGVRWSKPGWGSARRQHPSALSSDDVGTLRLERRHGFCTAAYPSWSRTSSPPGWFGRAWKMKGDRQIAETRAEETSRLGITGSEPQPVGQLIHSTAILVSVQIQSFYVWRWAGLVGEQREREGGRLQEREDQSKWLTAQTKHVSCQL